MSAQAKADAIVLPLKADADEFTCGSCFFFTRRGNSEWDAKRGDCSLMLPPQYARVPSDPEGQPSNAVDDNDRCDLWRSSGKTFIVSKRVGP